MPLYQEFAIRNVLTTLTGMQRDFLENLLADPKQNATAAASKAGYAHPDKQGPRLRQHPKIIAAIEEILHQQTMSRNEVLARLSQQAAADYTQYITKNGRIDLPAIIEDGNQHLIKHIKPAPFIINHETGEKIEGEPEITFPDSQTALVWLGKHYGLFSDKTARENDTQTAISDALTDIANEYGLKLQ